MPIQSPYAAKSGVRWLYGKGTACSRAGQYRTATGDAAGMLYCRGASGYLWHGVAKKWMLRDAGCGAAAGGLRRSQLYGMLRGREQAGSVGELASAGVKRSGRVVRERVRNSVVANHK
ncbi:hypothetical protein NPIL_51761 [Nephila pilipes]|uniref:Uncharacterized protein n=1 Tax=Nephila pilipes TaxID=299642 RepID=A0A8X6Q2Z9_NEPPI|nr:hypothetical protein NPIL_51761 [Nephila pilipes]